MLQNGEEESIKDIEATESPATSMAFFPHEQKTTQELKGAPPKEASWVTIGFLIIADIIGAGVMSLSSV